MLNISRDRKTVPSTFGTLRKLFLAYGTLSFGVLKLSTKRMLYPEI
jgi:hypothetical protein